MLQENAQNEISAVGEGAEFKQALYEKVRSEIEPCRGRRAMKNSGVGEGTEWK